MKNVESNYNLVLEVVRNYEDENMLNDFISEFELNKNISKDNYFEFCIKYNSDCGDDYYVNLNWKYIESGGDYSVYENE
jgi:hypothetical protein